MQLKMQVKKLEKVTASLHTNKRLSKIFVRQSQLGRDKILAGALIPKDRNFDSSDLVSDMKIITDKLPNRFFSHCLSKDALNND